MAQLKETSDLKNSFFHTFFSLTDGSLLQKENLFYSNKSENQIFEEEFIRKRFDSLEINEQVFNTNLVKNGTRESYEIDEYFEGLYKNEFSNNSNNSTDFNDNVMEEFSISEKTVFLASKIKKKINKLGKIKKNQDKNNPNDKKILTKKPKIIMEEIQKKSRKLNSFWNNESFLMPNIFRMVGNSNKEKYLNEIIDFSKKEILPFDAEIQKNKFTQKSKMKQTQ
jgi:hypothetical protein